MKKTVVFILITAAVLVSIWFKDGYILGTAEDGLIFYDISHYLTESQYAWMEHPGLGRASLSLTAAKPTYTVLSFLQKQGVPGFLIQAGVLCALLISSGLGIYFLTKELFPKLNERYLILSVFFYWFNPISLVNVWNRFLLNYIFFFALLPLATFFFTKGLRKKSYYWAFLLIFILPIFSFTFSGIAFVILLWMNFSLLLIIFLVLDKEKQKRIFYIKYFFVTLVLFLVSNLWWVSQLTNLMIPDANSSTILSISGDLNLGTLNALSQKLGNMVDILKFSHYSFFNELPLEWTKTFNLPIVVIMSYLITGLIFYAIIKGRKQFSILLIGGLYIFSLFLIKGSNQPFGEAYQLLFKNAFILQVLRNPFEKFGFLLVLSAAILLPVGVYFLTQNLSKGLRYLLFALIMGFVIFWGHPLYSGLAFTSPSPPQNNLAVGYKVKVPDYYQESNLWFENQGENFRYIGFPLGDEGITYSWEKGYSGVELAGSLFSTPGILYTTAVPFYYNLVPQIENVFLKEDFLKLANIINARYFFVREDIDFKSRKMTDPMLIKKRFEDIEKDGKIKQVAQFGKLTIWENPNWQDFMFYGANKLKLSSSFLDLKEASLIDVSQGEVLVHKGESDWRVGDKPNSKLPRITYRQKNPTKYIVHIRGAEDNFILVFSELFNSQWQAIYQNESLRPSSTNKSPLKHFRANFYANSWLVEKKGDYLINIEFLPQRWLDFGTNISSLTFVLVGFFLIKNFRRNR